MTLYEWVEQQPEVFRSNSSISRRVGKAKNNGLIRALGRSLYTRVIDRPLSEVVRDHVWCIARLLVPDSVVAHRTALEMAPVQDTIFVSGPNDRRIDIHGLRIYVVQGPGLLEGDSRGFWQGAHFASRPRAFLENLTRTRRTRKRPDRTLPREDIEKRLETVVRTGGEKALTDLVAQARRIAHELRSGPASLKELEQIASGLLGTVHIELSDPAAAARAGGMPIDTQRLQLFDRLSEALRSRSDVDRPLPVLSSHARHNLAFFDSYFSNYIEGTIFEVEEAVDIVEHGLNPPSRLREARDITGLYKLLSDERAMERGIADLRNPAEFLDLLRDRHQKILAAWPDKLPGCFKEEPNRAGPTAFVDPELVCGTLSQAFQKIVALKNPFARAALLAFVLLEVHPFVDGNGRLARAMMNAELLAAGQCPVLIPVVYRADYLDSLRALSGLDGNSLPYIKMLDRAQEFTAQLPLEEFNILKMTLEACQAFEEKGVLKTPDQVALSLDEHGWRRFWIKRGETYQIESGGYLIDPTGERNPFNQHLRSTTQLFDHPCLVLLGEPGMGKSRELKRLAEGTEPTDLKKHGSVETALDMAVRGGLVAAATIALDSIDECPNSGQINAYNILGRRLQDWKGRTPLPRLRITCRTADWPMHLENTLREVWGNQKVEVVELCPLRQVDVERSCERSKIDATAFLDDVQNVDAAGLAIRPLTLKILLQLASESESLPRDRLALYEQGCRKLAVEWDDERPGTRASRALSATQTLTVAGRIAAMALICGRPVISLDDDHHETDLLVRDITGGAENTGRDDLQISESHVTETLRTALFTGVSTRRVGFAHQTFAEFLAYRWLGQQDLDDRQLLELLCQPGPDGTPRVVANLRTVTAWTVSQGSRKLLFQKLIQSDPDLFLQVELDDSQTRAQVVDGLLEAFQHGKLDDGGLDLRRYARLAHPGLEEQLRKVISDPERNFFARRFAMDAVASCKLHSLMNVLADVCLDQEVDEHLRYASCWALSRLLQDSTVDRKGILDRLEPLVLADRDLDPRDELKGHALAALWPDRWTTKQMLSHLSQPQQSSFIGAYYSFLASLPEKMPSKDLPLALRWAEKRPRLSEGFDALNRLARHIVERAWDELERPEVVEALASFVVSRAALYDDLPRREHVLAESFTTERRRVLRQIVEDHPCLDKRSLLSLAIEPCKLLAQTDGDWLIERLRQSSLPEARCYAQLMYYYDRHISPAHRDELVGLYSDGDPAVCAIFESLFGAVDPNSDLGREMRETWERDKAFHSRFYARKDESRPDVEQHVLDSITRCEQKGVATEWWRLVRLLEVDEVGETPHSSWSELDIACLPGWQRVGPEQRSRIRDLAQRYVAECEATTEAWPHGLIENSQLDWSGYRALFFLRKREELPTFNWARWARSVGGFSFGDNLDPDKRETHIRLLKTAYEEAPVEVLDGIRSVLVGRLEEHGSVSFPRDLDEIWDSVMDDALFEWALASSLEDTAWKILALKLIEHGHLPAIARAESLLQDDPDSEIALASAVALWLAAEDCAWEVIWPQVQQSENLGKRLFESLGKHSNYREIGRAARLSPDRLAELAIFLIRAYPPEKDLRDTWLHHLGGREKAAGLREAVLTHLTEMGAHKQLEQIDANCEMDLGFHLRRAAEQYVERTWRPISPDQLLELVDRPGRRLVRSSDELLAVVTEALERIQEALHGPHSRVSALWSGWEGRYRPKGEEEVSDRIAEWLEHELRLMGIVAFREVQLRRRTCPGGKPGERTDILVSAATEDPKQEQLQLIIEVKGLWHRELENAMKSQLADRYMTTLRNRHGLYLVAWFDSPAWDPDDPRRARSHQQGTLQDLRERLDLQAVKLSQARASIKAFVLDCGHRETPH